MYDIGLDLGLFCAASSNLPFLQRFARQGSHNPRRYSCQLCRSAQSLNPVLFSIYHTPNSCHLPQNEDTPLNSFTDDRPMEDQIPSLKGGWITGHSLTWWPFQFLVSSLSYKKKGRSKWQSQKYIISFIFSLFSCRFVPFVLSLQEVWHSKVGLNKSKHFHPSSLKHYFVKCNLFKAMWQIQVYCKYRSFFVFEFFKVKTIKYPKVGPKVSHRLSQVRCEEWLIFFASATQKFVDVVQWLCLLC